MMNRTDILGEINTGDEKQGVIQNDSEFAGLSGQVHTNAIYWYMKEEQTSKGRWWIICSVLDVLSSMTCGHLSGDVQLDMWVGSSGRKPSPEITRVFCMDGT